MENVFGIEPLYAALAIFTGFAVLTVVLMIAWDIAQRSKKSAHTLGNEMANARIVVSEWADREGSVFVDGELWRATSKETLSPGDTVTVTKVDGLVLNVRKKKPTPET